MNSFFQLFVSNLKLLYRDKSAFAWNLIIPVVIYGAVAALTSRIHIAQFDYGDFLLPGVIAYVIMQGGIYSLAYWLVDLRSQGVIKRFSVMPIGMTELILSVIASRLAVLLLQVTLLTVIGATVFGAPFNFNIGSIILLLMLGGGVFLLLGLLISGLAGSYQAASPLTAAIGLPLMFLGNVFIPLDLFPGFIQTIGKLLPLTYLANGLRQAYLYPFDFSAIARNAAALFLWFLAILILALVTFRFKKE